MKRSLSSTSSPPLPDCFSSPKRLDATPPTSPSLAGPSHVKKRASLAENATRDIASFFAPQVVTGGHVSAKRHKTQFSLSPSKETENDHLQTKKKKKNATPGLTQLHFKTKSITTCRMCGMAYSTVSPQDATLHRSFHGRVLSGVPWPKALSSRKGKGTEITFMGDIILTGDLYTIQCIPNPATVSKTLSAKLNDVLQTIDSQLGAAALEKDQLGRSKVFLLVSAEHSRVSAAVVAEKIDVAFQVAHDATEEATTRLDFGDEGALFCNTTPVPVLFGIQRMWTRAEKRRKGLVSSLLDCVAQHFDPLHPVSKAQRASAIAFSQPTASGSSTARKWTASDTFRVFV